MFLFYSLMTSASLQYPQSIVCGYSSVSPILHHHNTAPMKTPAAAGIACVAVVVRGSTSISSLSRPSFVAHGSVSHPGNCLADTTATTTAATATTAITRNAISQQATKARLLIRGGSLHEDAAPQSSSSSSSPSVPPSSDADETQHSTNNNNDNNNHKTSDSKKHTKSKKKVSGKKQTTPSATPSASDPSTASTPPTTPQKSSSTPPSTTDTNTNTNSHQDAIVQEILSNEDYYVILGISKTATTAAIKKAYRRRAVQTHPDKMSNNDRSAFDKVAEAYDVLSDDTKRKTYTQYGKAGLQPGGGAAASHTNVEEMFRSFFGGNGGHRPHANQRQQYPRNRTVRYQLEVTLQELYQGVTREVIVTKAPNAAAERKRVKVDVPVGMASGQSIVLSGEMDSFKDSTPADIVFLLSQRPHAVFTRKGHDLAMELTITLKEAICGMERTVRHLDGRTFIIGSANHASTHKKDSTTNTPNSNIKKEPILIQDGDVQVLKGEGMPKPQNSMNHHADRANDPHGDLYVQFKVELPSTVGARNNLTSLEREQLGALLDKLLNKNAHPPQHERMPATTTAGVLEDPVDSEAGSASSSEYDVQFLERAIGSDFGRASGLFRMEQDHDTDPGIGGDEDNRNRRTFPFGGNSKSFSYFSGDSGGNSVNPFAGGPPDDYSDDGNNVQCQQM